MFSDPKVVDFSVAFGCALELSCSANGVGATAVMELFSDPEVLACLIAFGFALELTCGAEVVGATVVI